jgi:hypothetical protein
VIGYDLVFLPLEEQTELAANRIRKLRQYQFLLRPAVSEGTISTDVFPIDISTVTTDPVTGERAFPDRELLQELRSLLAANTGRPVKELLQEQEAALARYTQVVDGRLRHASLMRERPRRTSRAAATRSDPPQPVAAPANKQDRPVIQRVRIS